MTLHDLKDRLAVRAHKVQDAADRIKHDLGETRTRFALEHELDVLFQELGIEVYQRVRDAEKLDASATVRDLVDRIAAVEREIATHRRAES